MAEEQKSDHEVDLEFGQWMRDQRAKSGLTLEQVAQRSGIPVERLKSLELGYAEKGITMPEAKKVSAAYKCDFQEFLDKATGKKG